MPRSLANAAADAVAELGLPSRRQMGLRTNRRMRRDAERAMPTMSDKMMCLWKPAQSGKTRTIMEMIREHEETTAHLNIVICSNIRLLVSQTTARMSRDLFGGGDDSASDYSADSLESDESAAADDRIDGDVFSWMSGTARVNISTGELADRIKEDEVTMVVCCSHKRRFKYLNDLLANLDKSKHFTKRVSVWIDEADVSVRLWSDPALDFTRFNKVDRVCLVSATFNSVVRTYGRIKVMRLETTHPDCYVPLRECNVVTHESSADPSANLASVLAARPEMRAPGVRLFAPGMVEVSTHDAVATYLGSQGFAVMVLNGQRKCIVCPDGTTIPLALRMDPTNPDEISNVLPAIYAEHNLGRWPFAVTGQMCLGRGITFQSAGFMFDYGVIPTLGDPAAAYQCVARLLGNVREFPGFKVPTVFMGAEMRTVTLSQEKVAMMVAKKVLEKGWADVGAEEIDFLLHDDEERYEADRRGPVDFSPETFPTALAAKAWSVENLTHAASAMYPCNAEGGKDGECRHFKYRGELRAIASLEETLASNDLAWGQGGWDAKENKPTKTGSPRALPVEVDGATRYVVVFKSFYRKA